MLGGIIAAATALFITSLALLLAMASDDPQPDFEFPAPGDDLLTWAAGHPDRTRCPDTPAEEGL